MNRGVGLLHTVPLVAGDFERRVVAGLPGARTEHVARPWLLTEAQRSGVTDEVRAGVLAACRYLVEGGAAAILVTCSSIGEAAEAADRELPVPVLRVDAPMAVEAVRVALARAPGNRPARVAVLATLEATLGPTGRMLEKVAALAADPVEVVTSVCVGAFEAKIAGDVDAHDRAVVDLVTAAGSTCDVVVLAQASMASAFDGVPGVGVPVLSSPESGTRALIDLLR